MGMCSHALQGVHGWQAALLPPPLLSLLPPPPPLLLLLSLLLLMLLLLLLTLLLLLQLLLMLLMHIGLPPPGSPMHHAIFARSASQTLHLIHTLSTPFPHPLPHMRRWQCATTC